MAADPSTVAPELEGMPAPEPAPDADKAPRRRRPSRKRASTSSTGTSTPKPKPAAASVRRRIREVVNLAGGLVAIADPFDGQVILQSADELADAWAKVAERHPRIRAALEGFEKGGIYGAAILATASVAIPILAHHNMLPRSLASLGAIVAPASMPTAAPGFPMTPPPDPEPAAAGANGGSAAPLG